MAAGCLLLWPRFQGWALCRCRFNADWLVGQLLPEIYVSNGVGRVAGGFQRVAPQRGSGDNPTQGEQRLLRPADERIQLSFRDFIAVSFAFALDGNPLASVQPRYRVYAEVLVGAVGEVLWLVIPQLPPVDFCDFELGHGGGDLAEQLLEPLALVSVGQAGVLAEPGYDIASRFGWVVGSGGVVGSAGPPRLFSSPSSPSSPRLFSSPASPRPRSRLAGLLLAGPVVSSMVAGAASVMRVSFSLAKWCSFKSISGWQGSVPSHLAESQPDYSSSFGLFLSRCWHSQGRGLPSGLTDWLAVAGRAREKPPEKNFG